MPCCEKKKLKALLLTHPKHMRRDTALCKAFRSQGAVTSHARKLRDLAAEKLGMQIQAGEHSPGEDAVAALALPGGGFGALHYVHISTDSVYQATPLPSGREATLRLRGHPPGPS